MVVIITKINILNLNSILGNETFFEHIYTHAQIACQTIWFAQTESHNWPGFFKLFALYKRCLIQTRIGSNDAAIGTEDRSKFRAELHHSNERNEAKREQSWKEEREQ